MNFYNDIDPKACAWMQELIDAGEIAPGVVDSRSIKEIQPNELDGFDQCHFFCGIAGWPLALRWAGLDRAPGIWTGSCPCQPFSCAGKGLGTEDDRHLWPEFFRLIRDCRPAIVFGEQVASADVIGKVGRKAKGESAVVWLDGICGDLEGAGYATGSAVLGAFSAGAPHRRRRLYWMAHANGTRLEEQWGRREESALHGTSIGAGVVADSENPNGLPGECGAEESPRECGWRIGPCIDSIPRSLADSEHDAGRPDEQGLGPQGREADGRADPLGNPSCGGCGERRDAAQPGRGGHADRAGGAGCDGMGDTDSERCGEARTSGLPRRQAERPECSGDADRMGYAEGSGRARQSIRRDGEPPKRVAQANAIGWSIYDILPCRDGKARRVESGTFPLVNGLPGGLVPGGDPSVAEAQATPEARTMRLKGYGNAICPQLATEFITAVMEILT